MFLVKWFLARLASQMRAPHGGIGGWIAMTLMRKFNPPSIQEGIRRLGLKDGDTIVEIGPGHGAALVEIASSGTINLERIVCVEISEPFRQELKKTIAGLDRTALPIEIHDQDCKEMPYLEDESVDKIFGMNVVYFLDPLPIYLNEFWRVLKTGGSITFGCGFDELPVGTEFVNTEAEPILQAMKESGFAVETTEVQVNGGYNYIEIKGVKQQ